VVGSSCLVFETAPSSADGSDMSRFLAVVWTIHPDLIPREVGCVIPEAVEPVCGAPAVAILTCI
jgi:hypothetical protein